MKIWGKKDISIETTMAIDEGLYNIHWQITQIRESFGKGEQFISTYNCYSFFDWVVRRMQLYLGVHDRI